MFSAAPSRLISGGESHSGRGARLWYSLAPGVGYRAPPYYRVCGSGADGRKQSGSPKRIRGQLLSSSSPLETTNPATVVPRRRIGSWSRDCCLTANIGFRLVRGRLCRPWWQGSQVSRVRYSLLSIHRAYPSLAVRILNTIQASTRQTLESSLISGGVA